MPVCISELLSKSHREASETASLENQQNLKMYEASVVNAKNIESFKYESVNES